MTGVMMAGTGNGNNSGDASGEGNSGRHEMHNLDDEQLWELTQSESAYERGHAFSILGMRASNRGDYHGAAALHASEIVAAREEVANGEPGAHRGLGAALFCRGVALNQSKQFDEALAVLDEALEIYRTSVAEDKLADAALMRARALEGLSRVDDAVAGFLSAAGLYEACEKPDWRNVSAVYEAAEALVSANRIAESIELYERAQNIAMTIQDSFWVARARDQQAQALIRLGDIQSAVELFRQNVELATFMSLEPKIMYSRYRYGWALAKQGSYKKALKQVKAARAYFVENNDFSRVADIDEVRIDAYAQLGKIGKAFTASRAIAAYYRSVGEHVSALTHELNVAVDRLRRDDDGGVQRLWSVIDECDERRFYDISRIARLRLAEFLVERRAFDLAVEALNNTPTDRWGTKVVYHADHLLVIARCALHNDSYNEAWMVAHRVLDLASRDVLHTHAGEAYVLIASLHARRGEHQAAGIAQREAILRFCIAGHTERAQEIAAVLEWEITPVRHLVEMDNDVPEGSDTGPLPVITSRDVRESQPSSRDGGRFTGENPQA